MFGVLMITLFLTVSLVGSNMDTILKQGITFQVRAEITEDPTISQSFSDPADFEALPEEIKNYEPAVALSDNRDGFSFYRKIAEFSSELIKASGFLMLELGLGQAESVKEILSKTHFHSVISFQDLNEIDRILFCEC